MKKLLLAAVAGAALLSTGAANATPLLSIEVFDGATLIASSLNVPGGVNNAINNISDANFSSISASALGIPIIPSPDLSSTTINAKTNGGAATLTVLISQTNVTALSQLLSTFTFNALIGTNSSAALSNWIDAGNTAFALTTQIASATLTPTVGSAGPFLESGLPPSGLFSETERYVITYGAGHGIQSTSLTSQIVDAPEPTSVALLGVGMIGMGAIARRRRPSTTPTAC